MTMKKYLAFFGALLALIACTKELEAPVNIPVNIPDEDQSIVVDLTINRTDAPWAGPDTRASYKKTWEEGDVVFVFFNGVAAPKYLEMKYIAGTWKATQKNGLNASDLSGAADKKMSAVYLPYGSHATVAADGDKFVFRDWNYNGVFFMAESAAYTYETKLTGELILKACPYASGVWVHFDVAGLNKDHDYALYEEGMQSIVFNSVSSSGIISYSAGERCTAIAGYYDKKRNITSFSGFLTNDYVKNPVSYGFSIIDETDSVIYCKGYDAQKVPGPSAISLGNISNGWSATEFVYLGIDLDGEKLCWAKKNLGASVEKGEGSYGNYYAFNKVNGYGLSGTFRHYTCSHVFSEDTYDNDLTGDACQYELGGLWRVPTKEQFNALISQTSRSFKYSLETVNFGLTLSSKLDGYMDKSIFFPAAGSVTNEPTSQGLDGNYWTCTDDHGVLGYVFHLMGINDVINTVSAPYAGHPVRPVFAVPSLNAGDHPDPIVENHDYVDMGYGMKWATMNIGASGPCNEGDYFAWGETAPKSYYALSNYFDPDYETYQGRSGPTLGRPPRLKRADDAAYVLWGDDWRMPTYKEIRMLEDKSKFTWTRLDTDENPNNGYVPVYKVTSNQTGKSILLPLCGGKGENGLWGYGEWGAIWASSNSVSTDLVEFLRFKYKDSRAGVVNSGSRYVGYNIRPVRVNKVNGHEYIDLGNGLGWAVENLGTDAEHPSGALYSFDDGDPATKEWGAPWRTPYWSEWKQMLDEETRYKENSASFEQKGWWLVDREALTGFKQLPDESLFLPATNSNGTGDYWTKTTRSDGKRWQIHFTDDMTATEYTGLDAYKRAVRPVFDISDLEK